MWINAMCIRDKNKTVIHQFCEKQWRIIISEKPWSRTYTKWKPNPMTSSQSTHTNPNWNLSYYTGILTHQYCFCLRHNMWNGWWIKNHKQFSIKTEINYKNIMQQGKLKSNEMPISWRQSSLLIKNVIFNRYAMHISPTKHLTDSFH
jgi:hypothetical protein